jgi:hypothetical protein
MAQIAAWILVAILLIAVPLFIWAHHRDSRYSGMSSQEFEREAKRSSRLSAQMLSFQKIVDPSHNIEYIQQQDKHLEAEASESGDPPRPKAQDL